MGTRYYTIREVAAMMGSTEKALRGRLARGQFPYKKLGRRVLIPADQLEIFLAALPGRDAREAVAAVEEAQ
jgi:excisionase family DNA binding protein